MSEKLDKILAQILKQKKLDYALFDPDLILTEWSPGLNQFCAIRIDPKNRYDLWDVFSELIGYEDTIRELVRYDKKRFEIETINKSEITGKRRYYSLTVVPVFRRRDGSSQLLCILADTTLKASLEEKARQQENEILLLQANLAVCGESSTTPILGRYRQIQEVRRLVSKVAQVGTTTILLQGESGTGKNLIARAIHNSSAAAKGPFIEINCASIPSTLLESEIFGYEKGAFTNAVTSKKGLLEEADSGTFFLDEIGELPLSLQTKFLSLLEFKKFRRLGSTREQTVDVRIIAATNRDLRLAVERNEFRKDLFYRLNVVTVQLPPLRLMGDDILLLADRFISTFACEFHKTVREMTPAART